MTVADIKEETEAVPADCRHRGSHRASQYKHHIFRFNQRQKGLRATLPSSAAFMPTSPVCPCASGLHVGVNASGGGRIDV